VKSGPVGVGDSDVVSAVADGWDIAVSSADYAPVGFGSHHWFATDADQRRFFVTVDDLDTKPWLGDTCDSALSGLRKAFDAAVSLHDRAGLDFVLAPLPSVDGESVRRVAQRHSIAVFPFVDGKSGGFGDDISPEQRAETVGLLARLHRSSPTGLDLPPPLAPRFAGRPGLEAALQDLDHPWTGGPFSEPARAWLASNAGDLGRLLDEFDQVVRAVVAESGTPVITHGEPHPGNVMRSNGRPLLIDWDTVALALPERDLWHVATGTGEEVARYEDATGRRVSGAALSLYRQAWELADIAAFIDQFRSRHERTADTEDAWTYLTIMELAAPSGISRPRSPLC
jgi:spectinomycin phosphotransferase